PAGGGPGGQPDSATPPAVPPVPPPVPPPAVSEADLVAAVEAYGKRHWPDDDAPEHDVGAVLRIVPFRRLWLALLGASFGDWLGLLATAALAKNLASGSYSAENFAIAGVFILRLLPAVLLGPLAGAVADRLDRRWTLV